MCTCLVRGRGREQYRKRVRKKDENFKRYNEPFYIIMVYVSFLVSLILFFLSEPTLPSYNHVNQTIYSHSKMKYNPKDKKLHNFLEASL